MKKITIIGAGLTGLYAAYLLKDKYSVCILEARSRTGGRILSIDTHDLGPSWIWSHHKNILALLREFNLELEAQYTQGQALYQTAKGVEAFTPPPSAPSARVVGGIAKLVDTISAQLHNVDISFNHKVLSIEAVDNALHVKSSDETIESDIVIMTLPPRLAAKLTYTPALNMNTIQTLKATPTWMGNSRKCVIEYKEDFWRKKGLSGFCFSHSGPLSEIHDATTSKHPALFGFTNAQATQSNIKEEVIAQLVELFGERAKAYTNFYDIAWREEKYSADIEDKNLCEHPNNGYDLSTYSNRLHFISTESSHEAGGYLEGAIISAKELAKKLWYCNS